MTLLELNNLSVEYRTQKGSLNAVSDASIEINEGETFSLVGESGCGKTTLAKSIVRLLPDNGDITSGEVQFDGRDLIQLSDEEIRKLRWNRISIIPQSAMNALDPVLPIKKQFREVIQTHTDMSKQEARERTAEYLRRVNIEPNRMHNYAHELSGGQCQRVVIALALVLEPDIVIADEPTTGLDVVVQDDILDLIMDMQEEIGNSMVFITHDISVVAEVSDRVAVMYGGQLAEQGTVQDVFKRSTHPYTIGLNNAFPSLDPDPDELVSIPGTPPDLVNPPKGCRFKDRCPFSTDECDVSPDLETVSENHLARCHYIDKAPKFRERGRESSTWRPNND